jgi:Zn finger protein HypA/HybF involved in hydrogenase expression
MTCQRCGQNGVFSISQIVCDVCRRDNEPFEKGKDNTVKSMEYQTPSETETED